MTQHAPDGAPDVELDDQAMATLADLSWRTDIGPGMPAVVARARVLRSRRAGLLTAVGLLGAGAALGVTLLAGTGSSRESVTTATMPSAPSTGMRSGSVPASVNPTPVPWNQGRDLTYISADTSFGAVRAIDLAIPPAGAALPGCAAGRPAAIGIRVNADGKLINAALSVFGPSHDDPVAQSAGPLDLNPGLVSVRGTQGKILDGAPMTDTHMTHQLSWRQGGSGPWWSVESSGLTTAELVSAVNGLNIRGSSVDPSSLPQGFTAKPVTGSCTDRGIYWQAIYDRQPSSDSGTNYWSIDVDRDPDLTPTLVQACEIQPGVVQILTVDGATGYYTRGTVPSLTWTRASLRYSITGLPLDQALRAAHSLVLVTSDDPRLAKSQRLA